MRKLDAVLLSALILYDYSAQSLVDSDILSLGNSIIERVGLQENNFQEDKLTDPLFSSASGENMITAANIELNPSTSLVTAENNISYHALAKISPAAATVETNLVYDDINTPVRISTPNPFAADLAVSETLASTSAEETTLTLSVASVSTSFVALSSSGNIEVKDQLNEGNMQFADTDADGMFNFEDKCPGVAGVARFEGCPVPDSDADGVNDEEDRCPFIKGSELTGGCAETESPTTTLVADHLTIVQFEANNDVLSNKDFNIILQLADKIINNPGAEVEVLKSTDNISTVQANTVLSYLKDLGVKDSQMNVTVKDSGTNAFNTGVEVHIRF